MPEIINIRKPSTPEWAAFCALAEIAEKEVIANGDGTITVELKINGVEVSFTTIINRLKEEAVRWANQRAKDILLDKSDAISEMLCDVARKVEEEVTLEIRKLFPNVD